MAGTTEARGKTRSEAKKGEAKKDEAKKDEAKKGEAKKDEAKKGEAKSEAFLLRMSKDEKKMLGEKARRLGLEPSAFLRMLIRISDVSWVEKLLQKKEVR